MSLVLLVLGTVGLTLLVVSAAGVVWLVYLYEVRIKELEAQLRTPCPTCQAAAQGEAWGRPLPHREAERS